jgi:hypothetical protein
MIPIRPALGWEAYLADMIPIRPSSAPAEGARGGTVPSGVNRIRGDAARGVVSSSIDTRVLSGAVKV